MRQAVVPLQGFTFQFWQTVIAWVALKPGEELYIEGVEDFDVTSGSTAVVTQVKHRAAKRPITLASAEVITALNEFWKTKTANPERRIYLRYLTTAKRGWESPRKRNQVRGLDYWQSCASSNNDIGPLKRRLLASHGLSEDLRRFLALSDDVTIRDELVKRVAWDTDSPILEQTEEIVVTKVRAAAAADQMPLSRRDAIVLANQLVARVLTTAASREIGNRLLTIEAFRQVLEDVATVRLPKHEVIQLIGRDSAFLRDLSDRLGVGESAPDLGAGSLLTELRPPNTLCLPRKEQAAALRALESAGVVFVIGSTGTGKSTFAADLARAANRKWQRLDVQGHGRDQLLLALNRVRHALQCGDAALSVLVDNVANETSPEFDDAVARLAETVGALSQRVIVTAYRRPSNALLRRLGTGAQSVLALDYFDATEVTELVRRMGCPAASQLRWSRCIVAATRGHPQLAHAMSNAAAAQGWPTPRLEDNINPQSVREEREDTLRRVLRGPGIELALRLSVIPSFFKADVVGPIACVNPEIRAGIVDFEHLVGPLVEQVADDYYRVSPLLYGAGNRLDTALRSQVAAAVVETILERRSATPPEIGSALLMSIQATLPSHAARAALVVASAQHKAVRRSLCEHLSWMRFMGKEGPIFPSDITTNLLLRSTQCELLAWDAQWEAIAKVADRWEGEIAKLEDPVARVVFSAPRHLRLLLSISAPFSFAMVFKSLEEVWGLSGRAEIPKELRQRFNAPELAWIQCGRVRDMQSIRAMVDALATSPSVRGKFVQLVESCTESDLLGTMFGSAWMSMCHGSDRDPAGCAAYLEDIIGTVAGWEGLSFLDAAAEALSVVRQECLGQPEGAHAILTYAESKLGAGSVRLRQQRAKLWFQQGQFAAALDLYGELRAGWLPDRASDCFAARHAGSCAAQLGQMRLSLEYFELGERLATGAHLSRMRAGFVFDQGHSLVLLGEHQQGVERFAIGIGRLERLVGGDSDMRNRTLQRKLQHTLLVLRARVAKEVASGLAEPKVGWMSDVEAMEGIENTPSISLQAAWLLLDALAVECGVAAPQVEARLDSASIATMPAFDAFAAIQSIDKAFNSSDFSTYVRDNVKLLAYGSQPGGERNDPIVSLDAEEQRRLMMRDDLQGRLVLRLFVADVLRAARGGWLSLIDETWSRQMGRIGLHLPLSDKYLATLDGVSALSMTECELLARDYVRDNLGLGALRLATDPTVAAPQAFGGAVVILMRVTKLERSPRYGHAIGAWMQSRWLRLVREQRVHLQAPSLYVPEIESACQSANIGFATAAKVLLAVEPAISVKCSGPVQQFLRRLADAGK